MANFSTTPSSTFATDVNNPPPTVTRRFPNLKVSTTQLPFDVVESILNLLPAPDLLSASGVSTSWRLAAITSPRPRPPSLLLHSHTLRERTSAPTTSTITTSVHDPVSSPTSSSSWLQLPPIPTPPHRLRSSTSDSLLYTLTSTHLSFSSDPLHLHWTRIPSPSLWRIDPVVALVTANRLLVAAGVSEYEDCEDPLAVEVFSYGKWTRVPSMPEAFASSCSSRFLSTAVAGGKVYVLDRRSGVLSYLDLGVDVGKMAWSEPVVVVDGRPFTAAVAAAGEKLVVAGVMGRPEEVQGVSLWELDGGLVRRVGEMPEEMVARFAKGKEGDSAAGVSSVEVRAAVDGQFVYVYNPSEMGEVFYCTLRRRGVKEEEWGKVSTGVERGYNPMKNVVFTFTAVGIDEIRNALRTPGSAKKKIVF